MMKRISDQKQTFQSSTQTGNSNLNQALTTKSEMIQLMLNSVIQLL